MHVLCLAEPPTHAQRPGTCQVRGNSGRAWPIPNCPAAATRAVLFRGPRGHRAGKGALLPMSRPGVPAFPRRCSAANRGVSGAVSCSSAAPSSRTNGRAGGRLRPRWPAEAHGRRPTRLRRQRPPLPEAGDEAALPGCFNGVWGVTLADVGDRLAVGQPVQHGEAGQCRTGSPASAGTGDLDTLGLSACPCLA
jgi:hypothetical protein